MFSSLKSSFYLVRQLRYISNTSSAAPVALSLTDAAIKRIQEIIRSNPSVIGLRIGVTKSGCSGLSYKLEYATETKAHDIEIVKDNVKLFIDKKAQLSLIGSEMDFKSDNLSSEFVFNNPNVTATCGCGESFTVKKQ